MSYVLTTSTASEDQWKSVLTVPGSSLCEHSMCKCTAVNTEFDAKKTITCCHNITATSVNRLEEESLCGHASP